MAHRPCCLPNPSPRAPTAIQALRHKQVNPLPEDSLAAYLSGNSSSGQQGCWDYRYKTSSGYTSSKAWCHQICHCCTMQGLNPLSGFLMSAPPAPSAQVPPPKHSTVARISANIRLPKRFNFFISSFLSLPKKELFRMQSIRRPGWHSIVKRNFQHLSPHSFASRHF